VKTRPALVAPLWHTAVLIVILLAIAAYGVYGEAVAHAKHIPAGHRGSTLPIYLSLMAAEWGLFRFVVMGGLRRTGTPLRDLLGARWTGWRDVVRDVVIALLAWAAWSCAEMFASRLLGPDSARWIANLLPRSAPEVAAWVLLSLSAGFCEEVVFRGYLQRQFHALTGSPFLALIAQAILFGVSHGYQGMRNVIAISAFALLYGVLASWRKSLKPGMILHAWTDIVGGLFPALG